jgi:hypothetical protein
MKDIFIVVKCHDDTVMGVVLIHVCPLACIALKTVHRAPVIQTDKQTIQLFRERYTET